MNTELILDVSTILVLSAAGLFSHELIHLLFGRLFGGNTFFSRYWLGVPTQVDFRTPHEMSDRQVRIAAGGVLIFPCIALLGAYFRSIPLFAFGAGGIGVSMTDMLGIQNPKAWKDFTAGNSITREDFN
ncbi:hypothetical protein [Halobellus ordinarius]|uniref:hypothetical protein n=1 Tax=Halobellus ordinarius TaxID=3075120 RepID=UPI00288060E9|nr:hypothetical protein [Halobellus sp. ZY16]